MKTKLPVIAIAAFLFGACSTGTYVARTYDDDIYFSPTDVPPVSRIENESPDNARPAGKDKSDARKQQIIMSQTEKNADGTKTLRNDIYETDNQNQDYRAFDMDDQELAESDTTIYYDDDSVKYVINNYYEDDDDLDYAYRINRFHRFYGMSPFFYDNWNYGFYSPWYTDYYGWGWGVDPWYSWGWGYPYSYYGYYSPFAFGFGGYWGGYGGYYNGYYNGFYNGYYGSGGGYYNNHEIARRRSTNMNLPGGGVTVNDARQGRSSNLKNAESGGNLTGNGHVRNRSVDGTGDNHATKSATIIDSRRGTGVNGRSVGSETQVRSSETRTQQMVRTGTNNTGNVRRSYEPSTTGRTYTQGQTVRQSNYTPSYNKPRIVNQSNYNNNSYTRPMTSGAGSPRTTLKSSASGNSGSTYSQPRSSSSMRQTYRSSSTYSSGSSSSPTRSSSSYSSPSYNNSSSSPSYSAPVRSSSSGGSYSGGSSSGSSGGSSGGSSSGGGGGSGHRR